MAADIAPFHNYAIPQDVDGDYRVSPLDALIVINHLNSFGGGSLRDKTPPQSRTGMIDTDGDNSLSPLDALTVINTLNSGEGEAIKANVKYQFYLLNNDGTLGRNLDPNPNDTVSEALVNVGEKFVVRTLMADFRNNPFGVFSAYHDFNFTNSDGSTAEKMELQWSDYNAFKIGMPRLDGGSIAVLTGNFKLKYGTETTAAIPIGTRMVNGNVRTDGDKTAVNIQSALEQLPGIGAGNVVVRVNTIDPSPGYNFDIYFRNARARTNMPAPTIEEANFSVSTGAAPTPTISDIANPSAADALAARGALNYDFSPQSPLYVNGPNGFLTDISGTSGGRRLNLLGAFSNSSAPIPPSKAFEFFNIVDTAFLGRSAGTINLSGSVSPLPIGGGGGNNLGIALYNDGGAYLNSTQVSFENAVINIVDRLTAVNDSYPVTEDVAENLNVGGNDRERDGLAFGIVAVTQPTNGAGTVTFAAGGAAKSVLFTPTKDYFGPSTFTYTIRSSRGDEATATVTLDVLPINDPPVVVAGGLAYSATEDQTSPLRITPANIFTAGPTNEIAPPQSQTVSLLIITAPPASQGTASINTTTGDLEFLPAKDFFGTVNIVVRGTDTGSNAPPLNSNNTTATLTITVAPVNDAPVAVANPLAFTLSEGVARSIPVSDIFRAGPQNEIDAPQSQTVSLLVLDPLPSPTQLVPSIVGGQLVLTPQGDFFTLPDSPILVVVRGTDSGPNSPAPNANSTDATLTITINNVNDPPIAVNDAFNVIALGDQNTLNVLANDLPGPGGEPGTISVVSVTGVTPATSGTVQVATGGGGVVFTPSTATSVFGTTATFNYTINDQAGLPATATVTVTILPPASPFAVDDDYRSNSSLSIDEDTSATFDVLANDFTKGTKFLNEDVAPQIISGPGSVAIEGDLIRYTPEPNRFGEVVFTYAMDDTDTVVEENERRVATVTVLVKAVNDAPIAVDRTVSTLEDTNREVTIAELSLSSGAFENDSLIFISPTLTDTTKGSITFTPGSTVFTYDPRDDFFGEALVTYSVRDNGTPNLTSGVATITINVTPVNDPPVTSPKTLSPSAVEDTVRPITIASVIAGDRAGPTNEIAPPESQTVSFVALTAPITTTAGGTITQVDANTLSYSPAPDFNGTDTFVYTITDGQSANATAIGTVTINVSEVNDAPVARNITRQVFAGVSTVINMADELRTMSRGAANEISQTLVMSRRVTNPDPAIGTVTSFGETQFTFFAPLGTNGTTSFQYEVIDNGTTDGRADPKTSVATVTIEVLPFIPSTLRGTVFVDDDADGIRDRGTNNEILELPIGGVEVTLSYPDPVNPSKTISVTEMTEADGSYDFDLLPPGTYTVSYSTPMMMTNSSGSTMTYTRTIAAPGGANLVFDFAVLGIIPEYGSHLEYLASSFYNRDGSLRTKGMYAGVRADGITDWTSRKDGFSSGVFHELVLSPDGSQAYLSEVRADGKLYTATLSDRRQYIRMRLADGSTLVRVLVTSADLTWVQVNPATPPISTRGYLETVDDYFEQEGWDWT